MKKFLARSAFIVLAVSCTRSASTALTPLPTSTISVTATETQDLLATIEAQVREMADRLTQAAASAGQGVVSQPSATAEPQLVFADIDSQETVKIRRATWVVRNGVMLPRELEPLLFAPDDPNTRGEMTLTIGRLCLWEEIPEPAGRFTDLRLQIPVGASVEIREKIEQEIEIAKVSEELGRRGLYLLKNVNQRNLSWPTVLLSADEARTWLRMALESPGCDINLNPSPTTTP